MNKKLTGVFVLVLVLVLATGLVACNKNNGGEPAGPQVPDYVAPTVGATYGQTLGDLSLPEGFSWEEPLATSVGEVGSHVFHVTYTPSDTTAFQTVTGIEVTVTVSKGTPQPSTVATLNAVYGQTLANIGLSDLDSQAGTFAWQEPLTTSVGDAGDHVFHLVFTPADSVNYSIVRDIPVTVRVAKADYDMTGVALNGASVTYDGQAHSLAISGTLPEGVTVRYEGNDQVNAGTHPVRAIFTAGDQNHNDPVSLSANLIILKSDVTGITFSGQTLTYDGQEHSLAISGTLPSGVSVSYQNNGKTNVDEYDVVAHFTVNGNYNDVPDMHATLKINKATISGITFEDGTFTYDGQVHNLAISGQLPNGVSVEYAGNGQVNANVYGVTAHINVGGNYNAIEDLHATLTIEKAYLTGLTFPNGRATYDGLVHTHEVVGTVPEGVTVNYSYEWYDGDDWVAASQILNAGDYTVYAEFNVGNNFHERQRMQAEFTVVPATPDISELTDELYVIDTNGEYDKFGIDANAIPGVAPHRVNGEWPVPCLGYNVLLGDYAKRVGDPYVGSIDNNYAPINNVEFNVMGWDSSMYTVEASYNEQAYLSMLYLEDENVTLRMVDACGGAINMEALLDEIACESIFVYAYEGQVAHEEMFYGENKLVPIAVYQVYNRNEGVFFSVEKVTWHYINNEGDPWPLSNEVKYLINIDENTLEMSLYDIGEVVYVHANEATGRTLSFNRIGESAPFEYAVFEFDGVYTRETLPQYGARVGEWMQDDELILTNAYEGPMFEADENNDLHIIVGEQQYSFGFWADDGFLDNMVAPGEHYIVFSFNVIHGEPDDLMLWIYVFDEEVALDIDLSAYEPCLYVDGWEALTELGDEYPSLVACTYGAFNILQDGSLELNFAECLFTLNWATNPDDEGTYFLVNGYVYNGYPFDNEHKVESASYSYNAARGVVELAFDGATYLFDPTTRDLGLLKRHVGEVTGWIEMGYTLGDYHQYYVISSGFGQRWVFEYMALSIDDVLDGSVEPLLMNIEMEATTWRVEDDIVILMYSGEEIGYYTVGDDKMLTQYFGENVHQFIDYEYASEEDHTPIAGERFDFNVVLGKRVLFKYYFEGELDAYGNPVWYCGEESGKWEYSELGGFVTAYGYVGYWEPFRTFFVDEEGALAPMQDAPLVVLHYGYYYDERESVNIETHEVEVAYFTNVVMLGLSEGNPCSFVWGFVGKLSEDQIPTLAGILFELGEEKLQEMGLTGWLNPNECEWEYDGDYAWLSILNDKNTDEDDENYVFYYNGTELSTIPLNYETAYVFSNEEDGGYTEFYYAHLTDETKNAFGYAPGIWNEQEATHVYPVEPSFGEHQHGFWWIVVEKEGVNYMVEICNGYAIGAYPFDENGIDYTLSPSSIVYNIELEAVENHHNVDFTMFFLDMHGLAQVVCTFNGVGLTDEQIADAFEEVWLEGVWLKEGDYVEFLSRSYLESLTDDGLLTTEYDAQTFEIDGNDLVSGAEYWGTLRAIIVLKEDENDVTFAFFTYFDHTDVTAFAGNLTFEQASAQFALAPPEPVGFLQGSDILWAACDKNFYHLVEKDGVWSVEEVEFEPVWFCREDGDSCVLVKAGEAQLVFYVSPSDNILINGGLEDFAECEYLAFWGVWYQSPDNPNRIINYREGEGEYWLTIVDREAGELDWEPMP